GGDFMQWTGSLLQKRGFREIKDCSALYHRTKQRYDRLQHELQHPDETRDLLCHAYDRLLMAETSCNFYWGSSWVHRAFDHLEQSYALLERAKKLMPEETATTTVSFGTAPQVVAQAMASP
ncbi:MAG: hypothetical protein JW940_09085, partial [Polyangiaceae bacterium]|nr:hypothetical protein [Polyangiaceae bacterium]